MKYLDKPLAETTRAERYAAALARVKSSVEYNNTHGCGHLCVAADAKDYTIAIMTFDICGEDAWRLAEWIYNGYGPQLMMAMHKNDGITMIRTWEIVDGIQMEVK